MREIVKQILRAPNKISMRFPYKTGLVNLLPYFGKSELSDILSFGFSYIEHEDHCAEFLLVSPKTAKRIAKEIDAFEFMIDADCLGILWTARVILTDRVKDYRIVFSNKDMSVVLDLNINKMEEEYAGL